MGFMHACLRKYSLPNHIFQCCLNMGQGVCVCWRWWYVFVWGGGEGGGGETVCVYVGGNGMCVCWWVGWGGGKRRGMFKQSLITSFSSTETWDMVCVCTCICVICTEGGTLFWSKNIYKQGMETNWDGMVIAKIYGGSPVPVYNFWHGGLPGLPHSMNSQWERDDKDTKCCWIMLKIRASSTRDGSWNVSHVIQKVVFLISITLLQMEIFLWKTGVVFPEDS